MKLTVILICTPWILGCHLVTGDSITYANITVHFPRPHEISCSKLGCVHSGMTPICATELNNNNPVQPKAGFPLGGIFSAERLKMENYLAEIKWRDLICLRLNNRAQKLNLIRLFCGRLAELSRKNNRILLRAENSV